jgi:hypothetical protein
MFDFLVSKIALRWRLAYVGLGCSRRGMHNSTPLHRRERGRRPVRREEGGEESNKIHTKSPTLKKTPDEKAVDFTQKTVLRTDYQSRCRFSKSGIIYSLESRLSFAWCARCARSEEIHPPHFREAPSLRNRGGRHIPARVLRCVRKGGFWDRIYPTPAEPS